MLSVVIITKNEEKNIEECLESVKWAEEIVIVDDKSTDKTIEVIKEFGEIEGKVKIFERELNGDFAAQRNFGLEKATGDWVLFVDADERVSPQLREEIKSVTGYEYPLVKGYYLKREDVFFGKKLKHGETANVRLLRLGLRTAGKWEGLVHETWNIKGETAELNFPLIHNPHPTISEFLTEINYYSTLRAKELYQKDKHSNLLEIIFYPMAKFIQNYIIRGGLLDGMPGFVVSLFMSFHSFLVRSKLYLMWKQGSEWK